MKQSCPDCGKELLSGELIGIVRFPDGALFALPAIKKIKCCGKPHQLIALFDSPEALLEAGKDFLKKPRAVLPLPSAVTEDISRNPGAPWKQQ